MDFMDEAYLVGAKIAREGSAVVPEHLILRPAVFDMIMTGYQENQRIDREWKVVSRWIEVDKYQTWELHSCVIAGLTPEQVAYLSLPVTHKAEHDKVVLALSEFANMPLNSYPSTYAGSWYCNGIRWDGSLYDATGTIEVHYSAGRDV